MGSSFSSSCGSSFGDVLYPVVESFYSLQGEGFHSGRPLYFIRLGGCDVCCPWCDSRDSWPMSAHPMVSVSTLVADAISSGCVGVVITGGEPLLHDLTALCEGLRAAGLERLLESSGTHPLSGSFDWVCLSPKRFRAPVSGILISADELKVVVGSTSDFSWAESLRVGVSGSCRLFLQPEWGASGAVLTSLVEYIKAHPWWSLSLQTHKYIDIP